MDESPRYNPFRLSSFQFRLSTLFLATGLLCVMLTAANRLAIAYHVSVFAVFYYSIMGFVVWSLLGSLLGLAWAFHRTGTLRRCLGCILWPGIVVGIAAPPILMANAPVQILWYIIGALCILVIAFAFFRIVRQRSANCSGANNRVGASQSEKSEVSSTSKIYRQRFKVTVMSILVLAGGATFMSVAFMDIPAELRAKKRVFVALDEPIDVPKGMPVYKVSIEIGTVRGVAPSSTGTGHIMELDIFEDMPLYRNETCLISLGRHGVPQRVEITAVGRLSLGLDDLRDGDVIRSRIQ